MNAWQLALDVLTNVVLETQGTLAQDLEPERSFLSAIPVTPSNRAWLIRSLQAQCYTRLGRLVRDELARIRAARSATGPRAVPHATRNTQHATRNTQPPKLTKSVAPLPQSRD